MKKDITVEKLRYPLWLWGAGCAAGFLNGLLGAGAGIILVFVFSALSENKNSEKIRDNFAMTIAVVLPISLLSAYTYAHNTGINMTNAAAFLIPGAAGGLIGAVITDKINTQVLKTIFAFITVTAGINMLLR